MSIELGILGAGNMAEAIAGGVIRAGVLPADHILASDVSIERREAFTKATGVRTISDNREVAKDAAMLLLSVKPQHMATVLTGIADVIRPDALIVSIAAGIGSQFIEKHLGDRAKFRVIRTMPNTPMLIGEGMVALSRGPNASDEDLMRARKLFEASADCITVDESQLDAVTAVSGSGPAYVFYLVEQMITAAKQLGLNEEHSRQLAVKTALGAARMLVTSSDSPQELRRRVTSPGGTTQAAISRMDAGQWGAVTVDAIKAAAARGRELGA
jgi:pyrroline-5-carboxylate reductase